MPLCALILLKIIDQNLNAAVNAAVISIKSETADLERFTSALGWPALIPAFSVKINWSSRAKREFL